MKTNEKLDEFYVSLFLGKPVMSKTDLLLLGYTEREVRDMAYRLITEKHIPVCSNAGRGGYWIPEKNNQGDSDIKHSINDCRSRAKKLTVKADCLEMILFSRQQVKFV